MLLRAYAVRDLKAEVFKTPFFQHSHGEAERTFQMMAADEKSLIAAFPEDYDLFYLGEYDDNVGTIRGLEHPQHVMKAITVKPKN